MKTHFHGFCFVKGRLSRCTNFSRHISRSWNRVYKPSPFYFPWFITFGLKTTHCHTDFEREYTTLQPQSWRCWTVATDISRLFTHMHHHDDDWSAPNVLYASRLCSTASQLLSSGPEEPRKLICRRFVGARLCFMVWWRRRWWRWWNCLPHDG